MPCYRPRRCRHQIADWCSVLSRRSAASQLGVQAVSKSNVSTMAQSHALGDGDASTPRGRGARSESSQHAAPCLFDADLTPDNYQPSRLPPLSQPCRSRLPSPPHPSPAKRTSTASPSRRLPLASPSRPERRPGKERFGTRSTTRPRRGSCSSRSMRRYSSLPRSATSSSQQFPSV